MKSVQDISKLGINQKALERFKEDISGKIAVDSYTLFGSYSRGEAYEESDIDILVLTEDKLSHRERRKITDIVFEINLAFGTSFSAISIDVDSWNNGIVSVLSIHDEVEMDGIVF
jgi:predicted nucleotidyltransferase